MGTIITRERIGSVQVLERTGSVRASERVGNVVITGIRVDVGGVAPAGDFRIDQEGSFRVTDGGDFRIFVD